MAGKINEIVRHMRGQRLTQPFVHRFHFQTKCVLKETKTKQVYEMLHSNNFSVRRSTRLFGRIYLYHLKTCIDSYIFIAVCAIVFVVYIGYVCLIALQFLGKHS